MKYFLLAFAILAISLVMIPQQIFAVGVPLKSNYHVASILFDQVQYFTKNMFHCYDIEELCIHKPQEDRKKVTVTVTDPDENKFSQSIDRVKIFAWSDTYPHGITITAYETHVNSGVFEGTFLIADDASSQNKLLVSDGDSIQAKYIDTTLPPDYSSDSSEVTTSAFIGLLGVPAERVPVYNLKIIGKDGQKLTSVGVDQQIQITSDLKSSSSASQPFSYIVQIQDEKEVLVYLSWINGTLTPKQHFAPSISWTPQIAGKYTITVFVWEGIQNPSALSPPLGMDFDVTPFKIKYQTKHSNLTQE
jgi:hypothetical protein